MCFGNKNKQTDDAQEDSYSFMYLCSVCGTPKRTMNDGSHMCSGGYVKKVDTHKVVERRSK